MFNSALFFLALSEISSTFLNCCDHVCLFVRFVLKFLTRFFVFDLFHQTFYMVCISFCQLVWIVLEYRFHLTGKLSEAHNSQTLSTKLFTVHFCRCLVGQMLYWHAVTRWTLARCCRTGWRDVLAPNPPPLPFYRSYHPCTVQVSYLPCLLSY